MTTAELRVLNNSRAEQNSRHRKTHLRFSHAVLADWFIDLLATSMHLKLMCQGCKRDIF